MDPEVKGTGDALAVRNWINHNATRPCSAGELMEMWKSCTSEERAQFGNEARMLLAAR